MNPQGSYIDLSAQAKAILTPLIAGFIEGAAILVVDEIKDYSSASVPSGRIYKIPGLAPGRGNPRANPTPVTQGTRTREYRASAPGEAPAERLNIYNNAWQASPAVRHGNEIVALAFNPTTVGRKGDSLGVILELGHKEQGKGRIAPRPHAEPAAKLAAPKIKALADEASA